MGTQRTKNTSIILGLIRWMTESKPEKRLELKKVIAELKLIQPSLPEKLNKIGEEISFSSQHILGSGGQAFVFLGYFNEKFVAVKRFNNMDTLDPMDKEKVYRELNIFKKLTHPNIIKLFGHAEEGPFL